jgi:RNA polymerase sigma-70 factor (ECF subfamily)
MSVEAAEINYMPEEAYIPLDPRVELLQTPDSPQTEKDEALSSLIEEFKPRIVRVIERSIASPDDVEDITQETFVKMWEKIDTYRPTAPFGSWVVRIAQNSTIDNKRYESRQVDTSASVDLLETEGKSELLSKFSNSFNDPMQIYEHVEEERTADNLLTTHLSSKCSAVFSLRLEGFHYEEIAKILNISSAAARNRFYKAKLILANVVKQ